MYYTLFIAVVCIVQLTAANEQRRFIGRAEPMEIPHGWKPVSSAPLDEYVKLTFALKQSNVDQFFKIFWDVTDPASPNYGEYLDVDDLTALMAPSHKTLETVIHWLESHSITEGNWTRNKDFITIKVPISKAKELLESEFFVWQHAESQTQVIRSLGPYSVPHHVAPHLDFIVGSLGLPRMEKRTPRPGGKRTVIPATPEIIRERYNVSKAAIGGSRYNKQAVAEFLNNFYSPDDLKQFFSTFWPNSKFEDTVSKIIGENKPAFPSDQASLDLQYIMGVAPNVSTWYWSNTGNDFWSDLTEWVNQLASSENLPYVHAVGYGNQGDGPNAEYRDRLNTEFAKLGARGISILVASGDSGTGCYLCFYFEPSFPATSPYVTAVGSTQFMEQKITHEAAAAYFSSGGGFSWHFEQPSYQTNVITHYFATVKSLPDSHFYNAYGRGIPDVSLIGVGYQAIVGTQEKEVYGTATSTAALSGLISLLNEVRISRNFKTLGFLNTWLYTIANTYPDAFFDVTSGNNQFGCCGWSGFSASSGWDPVTGLGSPNFWILQRLVADRYLCVNKDCKI